MNSSEMPWASRFLWILAAGFVTLGFGYSVLTPIFENSDETLHYPYLKHLADGRGLPLAVPGQIWNQEGTQPPLYYALAAAATFWIDTDNLSEHLQRNPHWLYTEVRALINDNQNLVLHGPLETFPYRRAALAIHLSRWLSLAFGLVTVICTFYIGRYLFPANLPLVLTATALAALTPQFLRVSATVSNDSLSAALASLAVLLALRFSGPARYFPAAPAGSSTGGFGDRHALILGLLAGLALLTKLSSLAVLWLLALIVFGRLFITGEQHQDPLQKVGRWLLIMVATAALLTGWWFYRNYALYGEWLATETHLNLAGRSPLSLGQVWGLRQEAERAYWATFGWGQIRPPEWVYQGLFLFSRLGLAGLVLALLARLFWGDKPGPLWLHLWEIKFGRIGLLLVWAGFNVALYLRWVMEVGSVSHTRLVFPAISAISLLLALGWHAFLPRRLAGWFSGLVITLLLALNVYSLGWLIRPAFTPPPGPNESISNAAILVEKPDNPLGLTFAGSLRLAGGAVYSPASPFYQARPGDLVVVRATWQTLQPMSRHYSVAVVLLAPDGSVLARRETYPGLGLRPTGYLQAGETFVDLYPLSLHTDVTEPMVARAVVHLFDFNSADRAGLPAVTAGGQETLPIVGQIKIVPREWPRYQPVAAARATFGDTIALAGYDLNLPAVAGNPETPGALTLYWEPLAAVHQDYVVFVHLLDAGGETLAQADAPPTGGVYPTSWWAPGEVIADRRTFEVPDNLAAIRLGLYRFDTGERLPVSGSSLPTQNNSVEIRRW